jgi:oxygen-independent coproporphyrinogen III oxidase
MASSTLQHYTPCLVPELLPNVQVGGLYVHVPFCFHKCHYCDFYSITQQTPERMEDFVTLLLAEARQWADERGPKVRPKTIFFGGGTPTLLPMEAMHRLISGLKEIFDFSGVNEWTVEANPATVDESYCSMLRGLGVDRLSFGAQSFNRAELKILERHHEPDDVHRSVEIARGVGFQRINVDLIFAIPGQVMESWLASLNAALAFGTTHLSAYNLTYESNTPMAMKKKSGQIIPVDEATELAMLHETRRRMNDAGLPAYEISNFAAPGQECQHNLRYWSGDDYIGLGPAAASHVQGHRWRNAPNLGKWEDGIGRDELPVVELEILTPRQRAGELAMLQLRLSRGLNFADFKQRTGWDARQMFSHVISRFHAEGLLKCDDESVQIAPAGISVADALASEFLAQAAQA